MKCNIFIYGLGLLTTFATAQVRSCGEYKGYTTSVTVDFAGDRSNNAAIPVTIRANGKATPISNVGLDSGSTIFALDEAYVPGFKEVNTHQLKRGYVSYSGAKTYAGYWYDLEVDFTGKNGDILTSKVKALVVTFTCNCPWWDPLEEEECPNNPSNQDEECINNPDGNGFHYMGIRFGYNWPERGFTPDKNALLTITEYKNAPVDSSTFHPGYILHEDRIDIGLTEANTQDFHCEQLVKAAAPPDKWNWELGRFDIRLNKSDWKSGEALIDTGVFDLSLNLNDCATEHDDKFHLKTGTLVEMAFPNHDKPIVEWSFQWEGANKDPDDGVPPDAFCHFQNVDKQNRYKEPYVNTGNRFYELFDTLYDPEAGFWGARNQAQPATDASTDDAWQQELK